MEEIIRNWAKVWGKDIKFYKESDNFIWFTYMDNFITKIRWELLEEQTGLGIDSIEAFQDGLEIWLAKNRIGAL